MERKTYEKTASVVDGQIDELFARMDRVPAPPAQSSVARVDAFCASLDDEAFQPLRPASRERAGLDKFLTEDLTLAASAERMVKNVEDVYQTFQRLEQQFAGLERSCSMMLH